MKDFMVKVNGTPFDFTPRKGYCLIDREWKRGDTVEVVMNMPIRRIRAHDAVKQNRGRLAVERGPVLYCAEGFDNGGSVLNKAIAPDAVFTHTTCDILGNRYPAFSVAAKVTSGETKGEKCELKLIPYFAWCHRAPGNEMQSWFPVK
jgi:DUF1680 family protein